MRISRASTYALYGLSYLAGQGNGRRVPLSEIHVNHGVPRKHLAKIFRFLVRAGILSASRGVNGGFSLARDPRKVTLLDVVQIIDGPLREDGCLMSKTPCEDASQCLVNSLWQRAQGAMLDVLGKATLADVAGGVPPRARGGRKKMR